jgi:hypothetical protein
MKRYLDEIEKRSSSLQIFMSALQTAGTIPDKGQIEYVTKEVEAIRSLTEQAASMCVRPETASMQGLTVQRHLNSVANLNRLYV